MENRDWEPAAFGEGGSGRRKREQRVGLPGEIVGMALRFLEAIEMAMSK